jgi:hypothetical protein
VPVLNFSKQGSSLALRTYNSLSTLAGFKGLFVGTIGAST